MNLFGFKSGYPANLRVEEYKEAIERIEKRSRDRATREIEARFSPEAVQAYEVALKDRTPKQMELAALLEQALTVARHLLNYFVYMVIIIVVAVPEGLPMSVTVSLALAMRKMTRANSLVRQLAAHTASW